ncbi:MAG: hypothetical protein IJF03_07875 [Lachnospiraceae bacterium]|nr:hypothetical protein [Lachnospiraceae bacterium]
MKIQKYLFTFVVVVIFIFLLVSPANAVTSARSGLMLWFKVLLPTLLPFMIISKLLIELNAISCLTFLFSSFFKKFFNLSKSGTFVLMTGFLCGYPMGAKLISELYKHKQISHEESCYLLTFCNNLSPMFISSFLTVSCFDAPELLPYVILIIYGTPMIYALITQPLFRRKCAMEPPVLVPPKPFRKLDFEIIDTAIMDSFTQITKLGGYVILFSIISGIFLSFSLPAPLLSLLTGIIEITTGINYITVQGFSLQMRFFFSTPLCVFGGLSGLMQTYSMIKDSGLPFLPYLTAKLIQTGLSYVLTLFFLHNIL